MASQVLDTATGAEAETSVFGGARVYPRPFESSYANLRRRVVQASRPPANVRRRVPPMSGYALEKLGHAIEYLTDEYIHEGCRGGLHSDSIAAIQLLMLLNREVYFECPVIEPLWKRILRSVGDTFATREARIRYR
jgi:hypothetical protein